MHSKQFPSARYGRIVLKSDLAWDLTAFTLWKKTRKEGHYGCLPYDAGKNLWRVLGRYIDLGMCPQGLSEEGTWRKWCLNPPVGMGVHYLFKLRS